MNVKSIKIEEALPMISLFHFHLLFKQLFPRIQYHAERNCFEEFFFYKFTCSGVLSERPVDSLLKTIPVPRVFKGEYVEYLYHG